MNISRLDIATMQGLFNSISDSSIKARIALTKVNDSTPSVAARAMADLFLAIADITTDIALCDSVSTNR